MKYTIAIIFLILFNPALSQITLGNGEQPQVTVDRRGIIRVVYGQESRIYFSSSQDNGRTFSKPELVGMIPEMHLGMTRGPQLATSRDFSVVTAMNKKGNIYSFILTHKTGKWEALSRINDVNGSAPEGLMSIAADDSNTFYAVWLDLRKERKNNICFAVMKDKEWSANKFVYVSPEEHVCECCKPSVAVQGRQVAVMFRNWLMGSRDLYLSTSDDGGESFSAAEKLGKGTWMLKGCPMDGGGVSIGSDKTIRTAWQRDGVVFYSRPGEAEQRIDEGRHVAFNGDCISWENGQRLFVRNLNGVKKFIGEGSALTCKTLGDKTMLAAWEKDGQIVVMKF